jgi:hypothetical protein
VAALANPSTAAAINHLEDLEDLDDLEAHNSFLPLSSGLAKPSIWQPRRPPDINHTTYYATTCGARTLLLTMEFPTCVFSLYLLVSNIAQAAEVLAQRGWHLEDKTQSKFGNARLQGAHPRLTPPVHAVRKLPTWCPGMGPTTTPKQRTSGTTTTILLPASEWNYKFPEPGDQNFLPPLPALLDGLIDKLLDDPLTECMFWDQWLFS